MNVSSYKPFIFSLTIQLSIGSGVELPMWLIPHLATRNMVRVKMRKCFGERARRELEAGPSKVALRDHCKYYYIMGSSLCELYVLCTSNLLTIISITIEIITITTNIYIYI